MQELRGALDYRAVSHSDCLMTEAHAKDRNLAGQTLDDVDADASLFRHTRAGRQQDSVKVRRLVNCDGVVAADLAVCAELGEVLHQVEHKAVVVVDHEDAAHRWAPLPSIPEYEGTACTTRLGTKAADAAREPFWSTVTSVKGSRDSAHGNATVNNSRTTAANSTTQVSALTGQPPGR